MCAPSIPKGAAVTTDTWVFLGIATTGFFSLLTAVLVQVIKLVGEVLGKNKESIREKIDRYHRENAITVGNIKRELDATTNELKTDMLDVKNDVVGIKDEIIDVKNEVSSIKKTIYLHHPREA